MDCVTTYWWWTIALLSIMQSLAFSVVRNIEQDGLFALRQSAKTNNQQFYKGGMDVSLRLILT
jgi:hypothetical protein